MDNWSNDSSRSENMTAPTSSLVDGSKLDIPSLSAIVPVWSKICLIVFMTVALLLGVPGNSLVIAILLRLQKKTSTDWFVIFIALLDVISLLFSGPAQIIIILPGLWTIVSSTALCQFHAFIVNFVFLQSAFLIACVGIDRYYKTCKPYKVLFTAHSALRCSVVLALFSALFNVTNLFITTLNSQRDCTLDPSQMTLSLVTYGILLTMIFGSCVVMFILYSKIAIQIRRRVRILPMPSTEVGIRENKVRGIGHCPQNMVALNTHKPMGNFRRAVPPVSKQTTQQATIPECSRSIRNVKEDTADETQKMSNLTKRRILVKEQFQRRQNQMSRKSKQVNKTTKIMAAITLVFIASTSIPVIAVAILTANGPESFTESGRVLIFLMMRLYFINNFVNPIFYIWLSSAFRKNVVDAMSACKRKLIT